jgi:hypothetical protein
MSTQRVTGTPAEPNHSKPNHTSAHAPVSANSQSSWRFHVFWLQARVRTALTCKCKRARCGLCVYHGRTVTTAKMKVVATMSSTFQNNVETYVNAATRLLEFMLPCCSRVPAANLVLRRRDLRAHFCWCCRLSNPSQIRHFGCVFHQPRPCVASSFPH